MSDPAAELAKTEAEFRQHRADAVELVRDHPGVEHIWLNALKCVRPTDEFLLEVGQEVVRKVMAQRGPELDVLRHRHVVLRINAS